MNKFLKTKYFAPGDNFICDMFWYSLKRPDAAIANRFLICILFERHFKKLQSTLMSMMTL